MTPAPSKPFVCSFIASATERLKKEVPENELWERFKVQYKDLFLNFLHTEALRKEYERNPVLSTRVSDLPVSSRSKNALEGWIYDVGELIQCSEKYLLGFRGLGKESVKEIVVCLASMGLKLRSEEEKDVVIVQSPMR